MGSDEYWSLNIPGLTEEQAHQLRDQLGNQFSWGVLATDPRVFMVRAFDRPSVEVLVWARPQIE